MPARHAGKPRPSATRRLFLPALAAVVVGLVVGVLGVVEAIGNSHPGRDAHGPQVAALPPVPPAGDPLPERLPPSPTRSPVPPAIRYPESGSQSWRTVAGRSPVLGEHGQLMRFRVAVEKGITGINPEDFADAAVTTLGDPRSWTGDGQWRLQRVGPDDSADFTLYLATPATRDKLCADGYDRYTSCRNGASVVINVARWAHGIPNYGAPLATYRQYVINHEVGHRLGHGHELCPGSGKVAPVMQQQTLGMHGCKPNAWPLRDGEPYAGRPGHYDDPIPTDDH